MAICCPKSIKACALRITRLNADGVPLDPLTPNSRIQTAGFVSLSLSPDVESGDSLEIANKCGDICITDRGCDRLKGFSLELKLCGIPLPVLEMLTDATLLSDENGDFTGAAIRESKSKFCSDPVMLELWTKNVERGSCGVDGVPTNLWVHWLLPKTIKWTLTGSVEFSNGPTEFTLSGYAENNPNFYPSFPGPTFASYVPGGGDPAGYPTGDPPPVLPSDVSADPWTLADQAAIQGAGGLAWKCVSALPTPIDDCSYVPTDAFSGE